MAAGLLAAARAMAKAAEEADPDAALRDAGAGDFLEAANGEALPLYAGAADAAERLTPTERRIAAAGRDGKIRIWSLDAPTDPVLTRSVGEHVRRLTYEPTRGLLIAAGEETLRAFSETGDEIWRGPAPRTVRPAADDRRDSRGLRRPGRSPIHP